MRRNNGLTSKTISATARTGEIHTEKAYENSEPKDRRAYKRRATITVHAIEREYAV